MNGDWEEQIEQSKQALRGDLPETEKFCVNTWVQEAEVNLISLYVLDAVYTVTSFVPL